jgi:hypothetical protein
MDAAADGLGGLLDLWIHHVTDGEPVSASERIDGVRAVNAGALKEVGDKILALDTIQLVLSGVPRFAEEAVQKNKLGKLEVIRMAR